MLLEIDHKAKRISDPVPWPVPWTDVITHVRSMPTANQEAIVYGYQELVRHIFYQAVQDAKRHNYWGCEARRWLREDGYELLTLAGVGIQPDIYHKWIKAGCPKKGAV